VLANSAVLAIGQSHFLKLHAARPTPSAIFLSNNSHPWSQTKYSFVHAGQSPKIPCNCFSSYPESPRLLSLHNSWVSTTLMVTNELYPLAPNELPQWASTALTLYHMGVLIKTRTKSWWVW
jgi:hypothetical protein